MRELLTMAAALVGAGVGLAAPVPKAKGKTLEEKLVGTWKLVPAEDGKNAGYTLYVEYKAGGAMEIRYEFAGLLPTKGHQGSYKAVEPDAENKLGSIEWSVTEDGETRSEVAKIDKLTDDELTEIDPEGVVEQFVRVKPDKKDK